MQVSIETTSGLERRLTVSIPAATVDDEVTKRLKEATKTVRINGFRKGKVPFKVVKQRYGAGVRQEVIGDTINKSFYEALQQESVRPAGQPAIEPKQMNEGQDIEFIATFEVYPQFEVTGLDDISVTKYTAEINDSDIDTMIENLRDQQATWADSAGQAKKKDQVNIDFEGTKEGEAFEGGTASGQDLVLGSGSMIPGFEDGIVGMKKGDEKSLELTFPEDYHAEELKGAAVVFNVKVNAVQKKKKPKVDDEFFAKFGVNEGGEEKFREDVKANMEREKERAAKAKTKDQILNGLIEKNEVEVPDALIASEIEALRNQTVQQYGAQAGNMDFKSLLPDDMFKAQAERRAILGLIVSEIVSKESLTADKDIVRGLIEEAASTYEDPTEVINYYYGNEQLLASVEAAALEEQVVNFVLDKAKVSEENVSYEDIIKPLENKS